jgi:phosphorylase kinase alpha/beta subunit
MSAGGLAIVRDATEVAFVQNLVHYLAKAYRTPDYGIWERGHKQNDGQAEVNASSVGMAKAALEAVDGLVLLPGQAPAIHVQADDIARARTRLAGLLPRESESKETDAALLSIIGFPAFAVEDAELAERTRAEIIAKLQGRYGCKRFLRDGHQTAPEDHSRLHYEPGELQRFEHIESEWPLFFCYLLLDALLRGDTGAAWDYRARLEALMVEQGGQRLLPELYFVPAEAIDAERAAPHSQTRLPNDNVPLVWAQSLYLVAVLLQEGYIDASDLDPLGRLARRAERSDAAPQPVQIALLATDAVIQARLAGYGAQVETIAEATGAPAAQLQVRYADVLDAALTRLGACTELGLSGRPARRIGTLATSRVCQIGTQRVVFLPAAFNRRSFYLTRDTRLLLEQIRAELADLLQHWHQPGAPLLVVPISAPMLRANGREELLAFVHSLTDGHDSGLQLVRLADGVAHATPRQIDWLEQLPATPPAPDADLAGLPALPWDEAATRPLHANRAAALEHEHDSARLQGRLLRSRNPYEQIEILGHLAHRHGLGHQLDTPGGRADVGQLAHSLYTRCLRLGQWGLVRRAAGVLDLHDEVLEDAVAQIVLRHKRISVGRAYHAGAVLAGPLGQAEILDRLKRYGGDDARGRVLIQEIVVLLGSLIRTEPALFEGTLTLRAWYLLLLVTAGLAREHGLTQGEAFDFLLELSPHAILVRLREVITSEQDVTRALASLQTLHAIGASGPLTGVRFLAESDPQLPEDVGGWQAWRELTGVLTRVPGDFYTSVWQLLNHFPGLVIGDQLDTRNRLDSGLARADMTAGERSFALRVEDLLSKIAAPEYRQLNIEALLAVSAICQANPAVQVGNLLVMDVLIGIAVRLNWQTSQGDAAGDYNEQRAAAWHAFYALPPHQLANAVMAAFSYLLAQGNAASEAEPDATTTPAAPADAAPTAAQTEAATPAETPPADDVAGAPQPVTSP